MTHIRSLVLTHLAEKGKNNSFVQSFMIHADVIYENLLELRTNQDEKRTTPYAIMAYFHDLGKINGSKGHEKRSAKLTKVAFPTIDSVVLNAIERHMYLGKLETRFDYLLFLADKSAIFREEQRREKTKEFSDKKLREYVDQKKIKYDKAIKACPYLDIVENAVLLRSRYV
jgi:HD superfamily phosphohydrolase YqeK